jgi:hypothetical protein
MSKRLILSLILSMSAVHADEILIMGAGGEPLDKSTTIFDKDIQNVGKFVKDNRNWRPQLSFNGGHSETETHIRNTGIPNKPFTADQFEKMISDYERRIKSGDIKSGEKLLVFITTHGAKQVPGRDVSHKIAVSGEASANLNELSNSTLVSLDRLQSLIDIAERHGVKLGLLDFSCHSGSVLNLKTNNTCLISSSGPKHFGYASWGGRFAANMKKGKNLEQVFLDTFVDRNEVAFPMMNTKTAEELQDDLYKYITPYLYTWNEKPGENKLTPFLEERIINNQCQETEDNINNLLTTIGQLKNFTAPSRRQANDFKELEDAAKTYHSHIIKMQNEMQKMDLPRLDNTKEKFCTKYTLIYNGPYPQDEVDQCTTWSYKELLQIDYDKEIESYRQKIQSETFANKKRRLGATLANIQKAKAKKEKLMMADPSVRRYVNYFADQKNLQQNTWDMALNVSKALQKVYKQSYEKMANEDRSPNPCRDFVL